MKDRITYRFEAVMFFRGHTVHIGLAVQIDELKNAEGDTSSPCNTRGNYRCRVRDFTPG